MSNPRQFRLVDLILLLGVLALAGYARGWYLSAHANAGNASGPMQVQGPWDELKALVENLKNERAFRCQAPLAPADEQTAHVGPGYPAPLAGLELLPIDLSPIDRTVRWIQWALGTLTAGIYFLFARRAFRSRLVGTLTGFLCALHPFWIINTAEINDGVLTTFLLAAGIALGARGGQWGGALTSLLYGLGLAALALVRAATLPFAFVALLWFLLRCRSVSRGWLRAVLAVLGFANGLAPWTLRNYRLFGDLVPVVDCVPYHLWVGNNPRATGGPLAEQPLLEALAAARGEDPKTTTQQLGQLNQVDRYNQLGDGVRQEIRNNPVGALQRRLWAALYFFFGEDSFTQRKLWRGDPGKGEEGTDRLLDTFPAFLSGALLLALLLGVLGWRWTFGWRKESMPASLAAMWIPLPYILSHAEALSGPRLPLDGVFLCYAAFAIASLIPFKGGTLFAGADASQDAYDSQERASRGAAWR